MSAPSLAVPDAPRAVVAAPVASSAATQPAAFVERRSHDPVSVLSRQFDSLCTAAVDAAEIAAGLESAGFTDGTAREYGFPDVFSLAEALFARTPRLVNRAPGRLFNPWTEHPAEHLLRGVAFAAPGLLFVACLPVASSLVDRLVLVASLLLGWPGSQTMAFTWHLMEGRRHSAAGRAALAVGLASMTTSAVGLGLVALVAGASGGIAALAAAQVLYVAASAVVLVSGRVRLALAAIVPGLVGGALRFAEVPGTAMLTVALALISLLAATGAAVAIVRATTWPDVRSTRALLRRDDRISMCWHAGYGALGGLLVCLPSFGDLGRTGSTFVLLPLIWSMGLAEWRIVRLRRQSFDLLNDSITVGSFRQRVRRQALVSVNGYIGGLLGLSALTLAIELLRDVPLAPTLTGLTYGLLLGLSFYPALVVSSMGRVAVVVRAMGAGALAGLLALLGPDQGVLVAPLLLGVLLIRPFDRTIADPTRHM